MSEVLPTEVKRATIGKVVLVILDNGQVILANDPTEIDGILRALHELPEDLCMRLIRLTSHDPRPGPERFVDIEKLATDPRLKALEVS